MEKSSFVVAIFIFASSLQMAQAGILHPECNTAKAAKNAAIKSATGVSGRCTPSKIIKRELKETSPIDDVADNIKNTKNNLKEQSNRLENKTDNTKNAAKRTKNNINETMEDPKRVIGEKLVD